MGGDDEFSSLARKVGVSSGSPRLRSLSIRHYMHAVHTAHASCNDTIRINVIALTNLGFHDVYHIFTREKYHSAFLRLERDDVLAEDFPAAKCQSINKQGLMNSFVGFPAMILAQELGRRLSRRRR